MYSAPPPEFLVRQPPAPPISMNYTSGKNQISENMANLRLLQIKSAASALRPPTTSARHPPTTTYKMIPSPMTTANYTRKIQQQIPRQISRQMPIAIKTDAEMIENFQKRMQQYGYTENIDEIKKRRMEANAQNNAITNSQNEAIVKANEDNVRANEAIEKAKKETAAEEANKSQREKDADAKYAVLAEKLKTLVFDPTNEAGVDSDSIAIKNVKAEMQKIQKTRKEEQDIRKEKERKEYEASTQNLKNLFIANGPDSDNRDLLRARQVRGGRKTKKQKPNKNKLSSKKRKSNKSKKRSRHINR